MSRKNKSRPNQSSSGAALGATPDAQAEAALGTLHFKDAIEHFKALLKRERRDSWIDGLAAAYAGRAEQLVAKGMLKEALALWRTRAQACGTPLLSGPYVGWLMKSGDVQQVIGLLRSGSALAPQEQAMIQNQLAAAVLVAPDGQLAGLLVDSPLQRHRAAARAALAAVVAGDDTSLAEALEAIPFRSPYRDLRSLLKAISLLRSNPQQAAAAVSRLTDAGGFERLAAALRVAVLPAEEWLASLHRLDEAGRDLVLELKGCPTSHKALVMELVQCSGNTKPIALYDLIARHRRDLPEGLARQLCSSILPHAPHRLDTFPSAFGAMARGERVRIMALAEELNQHHHLALIHWQQLADLLRADPAEHRRAALVLRHLADERHFHEDDGTPGGPALRWLEQSLELDPTDREAELRLLRSLRERGDLKRMRVRLAAARTRFPDDAAVLLEAVETALASGAFKKAIGLAKQVLVLDPINPRVRSVIGQAHLSHARKQIEARNSKAAQRELDEAGSWLRGTTELATLVLLRGLAAESPSEGDVLLRQALAELGVPLVGAFHLAVEAERARLSPGAVLQRVGADLHAKPDATQLVELAHALKAARPGDRAVREALNALRPMLQRAATAAPGSESELVLLCEALHGQKEHDLTRRFAGAALQLWPGQPTFVYYDAAARCHGKPWRIPAHDLQRLDKAFERARAEGDRRSTARLGDLLQQAYGPFGGAGGFDELDDDDDETFPIDPGADPRDVVNTVLALGGEDQFLDLVRHQFGKATFEQMRRDIGGSKKQFIQALVELVIIADKLPFETPAVVPSKAAPRRSGPPADEIQKGLFDD